ncbi:MAG: hypothetical protein ACI4Q0_02975 [Oligosphaeraceae bacterium]
MAYPWCARGGEFRAQVAGGVGREEEEASPGGLSGEEGSIPGVVDFQGGFLPVVGMAQAAEASGDVEGEAEGGGQERGEEQKEPGSFSGTEMVCMAKPGESEEEEQGGGQEEELDGEEGGEVGELVGHKEGEPDGAGMQAEGVLELAPCKKGEEQEGEGEEGDAPEPGHPLLGGVQGAVGEGGVGVAMIQGQVVGGVEEIRIFSFQRIAFPGTL